EKIKVDTKYAEMSVTLSNVRSIEFDAATHAAQINFVNGDQLSGQLGDSAIAVKTIFGQASIPVEKIARVQVRRGGIHGLPEGVVLHYSFDSDDGAKVTDTSGSGNDGEIQGAPTYTKEGKVGGAMSFTDRQVILVKNPANMDLQDFTISAWIKRGSLEKVSNFIEDGVVATCGQNGYGMGLHRDGSIYLCKVGINAVFSPCKINDQDFHHIAVTKKGSTVVFYLDGVAFPANNFDTHFEFGTGFGVGARPDGGLVATFIGTIDEVTVFNRPLSANEIKDIYDSQK
ncbi:MAG TPA: LamG domain-containing protein, partial [Chthoniobacteraceae bacterium]|nr:LamG domain-containing protein [Chthoniobacteraceae bacterium]